MKTLIFFLALFVSAIAHAQELPISASSPEGSVKFEYDHDGKLKSVSYEYDNYLTVTRDFTPSSTAFNSLLYWNPGLVPNIEEVYQRFDTSWVLMQETIIQKTPDSTIQIINRRTNPTDELQRIERRVWYTDPVTGLDLGSSLDGQGYLYRYRIHKNDKGLIDTIYFESPQGSNFYIEAKYTYEYDSNDTLRTIYQLSHTGSEELVPIIRWKDITWTSSYLPSWPSHAQLPFAGANWVSYKTDHYNKGNLIPGDSIVRTFNEEGQVVTWGGLEGGMQRYSEYNYYPDNGFRSMFTMRLINNDWDTTHHITYDLIKKNGRIAESILSENAWDYSNVSRFTYHYSTSSVGVATPPILAKLYPNPAHDFVVLDCSENSILRVYDVRSNIVLQTLLLPGSNKIDLLHLPAETYFLSWTEKGKTASCKVIKQ